MKRRDLLRHLRDLAKVSGVGFDLVRNGAAHDVFQLGDFMITMPRHREINERTAQGILKGANSYLREIAE